jgi:arginase family enzyme
MSLHPLRILNFDDSLLQQYNLIERFKPEVVDLKHLGDSGRLWLNEHDAAEIRYVLGKHLPQGLSFLGSGDYHHISALLIERYTKPVSVIVFDAHPDWDILPPHLGCGSWVSYILCMKHVEEVVIFGLSADDISTFWIQTAELNSLQQGRVRVYPYAHEPTRVFFKPRLQNPSIRTEDSLFSKIIHWQQLKGKDLREFIPSVLGNLAVKDVYVSIDKDCLKAQDALTNWDEGQMSLGELTSILQWIKKHLCITGADITGEYSECRVKGLIKNICSRFDHPRNFSARDKFREFIDDTNEHANIRLLETLLH